VNRGGAPRRSLPHGDVRHQRAHHFLIEEAALLDGHHLDAWLALLTDDVRYRMPVRVTTTRSTGFDTLADMAHFDEDRYSLAKRVARLGTDHAWTEDPASRTRHLVTNVRTFATDRADELEVESSVLLFRSRGDTRQPEIVCALRVDRLREIDGELRLASREVLVEESVLRTQNLAIFL
jgi:phthalate 3,4-dioxygenase subunit beta